MRIVLADSQAIDRSGMKVLLESQPDFRVVRECASVDATIGACRTLDPDVLVLALSLPGQDEKAAVPAIRAKLPTLKILALAVRGESSCLVLNPPARRRLSADAHDHCPVGTDCLHLAAAYGAMGTLRRTSEPEELFRAIRMIAEGRAWYDPGTSARMLAGAGSWESGAGTLSVRELGVAALIAEGHSNKEISTALGISEATVKKHVGHIMEKMGLADRLQVGLFLARHPLLLGRN